MEKFIKKTILQAGKVLMTYYKKPLKLTIKQNVGDYATPADLASQNYITNRIRNMFPSHSIISEEGINDTNGSDWTWYIDPLDGTRNFATQTPLFGINIGVSFKGQIKYGAVFLPVFNELYFAENGKGAFLNNKKIRCSKTKEINYSYGIGFIRSTSEIGQTIYSNLGEITKGTVWINSIACTAVTGAWLASGKRDWYVTAGKNSWDFAAIALIMRESGLLVVNSKNKEWQVGDQGMLVCNKYLYPKLKSLAKLLMK